MRFFKAFMGGLKEVAEYIGKWFIIVFLSFTFGFGFTFGAFKAIDFFASQSSEISGEEK